VFGFAPSLLSLFFSFLTSDKSPFDPRYFPRSRPPLAVLQSIPPLCRTSGCYHIVFRVYRTETPLLPGSTSGFRRYFLRRLASFRPRDFPPTLAFPPILSPGIAPLPPLSSHATRCPFFGFFSPARVRTLLPANRVSLASSFMKTSNYVLGGSSPCFSRFAVLRPETPLLSPRSLATRLPH